MNWSTSFIDRNSKRRSTVVHSPKSNRFDIWLVRISYISQFGLLLLTLFTLYYTVLPLYRSALLEEAISRKELELTRTNLQLEKTYESERKLILGEFIFHAGALCSGMLDKFDYSASSKVKHFIRSEMADRLFAIDVGACLKNELKTDSFISELRIDDYNLILKSIETLNQRLVKLRQQAMLEVDNIPEYVRLHPDSLLPPSGMRADYIDLTQKFYSDLNKARVSGSKIEPNESFDKQRFRLAIEIKQANVVSGYGEAIRNGVLEFRNMRLKGSASQ